MSEDGVFETELRVRFGDVDRAGIAYYPRILHYCHVAFEEFFERGVGVPYSVLVEQRFVGFPTVKLATEFERPFRFGARVIARVAVPRVGRTSATFAFAFAGDGGAPLARSTNESVAVDMRTFRPVPVPDDLRAAFARFAGPLST